MESYTLIFENETMFRRGCISHQKGDGLVNPIKQFRRKNLRLSSSELLSKRGLVFLRSQTHPKGKKEQFLQFILTWITINSSKGRCTSLLPWRSQCKAQRPGVTHEAGCFAAGAWNPLDEWNCTLWYTRSEPAIGQVKAMRVEVWFATFGACLLYPISERRTILRSGVSQNWKRDSFFFGSILPNTTETTRTNHSEIWLLHQAVSMKKELLRRHWKFTNDSHTAAKVLGCYDCLSYTLG